MSAAPVSRTAAEARRTTRRRRRVLSVLCCVAFVLLQPLPRVLILGPRGAGKSTFLQGFTDATSAGAKRTNKPAGEQTIERKLEWGSEERTALLIDRCGADCFDRPDVAAIVFVIDASKGVAAIEREAKPMLDAALARAPVEAALLVLANKQDVAGALSVPEVARRLGLETIAAETGRACHIEGSSLAHAAGASADETATHSEDFAARGVDWLMAQLHGEDPSLHSSGTDHALRGGDNTSDEDDEDSAPIAGQNDDLYGGRLPHLPCIATARTDYQGTEDGALSFRFQAGQSLVLLEDRGGVLRGSLCEGGRLGAFPKGTVEVSEFELARAAAAAVNGSSVLQPKPQILCLLLGLLGAGKSTLLARLRKPGAKVNRMAIAPTLAFTPHSFEMGRVQFGIYDLGRGEQLHARAIREQQARSGGAAAAEQTQQLPWNFSSEQAQALIFVVDSADAARIDEARHELLRILCDPRVAHAPLLILASKADLPGALSLEEITRRMQLDQLPPPQRNWRIEACSVKLVGDAQTPVEQPTAAAAAASASSSNSGANSAERKQSESESKIDDAAAAGASADGTEGLVRGFRWIAEQLHPAAAPAATAGDAASAAAPTAVSPCTTLAALQSHFPSLELFSPPIAAVATNYVDAAQEMELSLYPGQSVEVLGTVKERARFVVRVAASSSAPSASASASAAASAASPSPSAAAATSVVGLVPFNTLRSRALDREHDAQMAHVARGARVDPASAAARYVAVGDWEGRGAAPIDAASNAAAASSPSSPVSPSSLPTSGELSFPRGSTLLVNRDLGHWLRGHLQGAVAGQSVGAEGLIPSAWVRTAAFVEAQAAEQEAKSSKRQGGDASGPARRGGRT